MNESNLVRPLVEVFSGQHCAYCSRAKQLLGIKGVPFREYDISEPEHRTEMARRLPRARSIPQIFVAGEHIGGCEDMELLNQLGRLDALLTGGAG